MQPRHATPSSRRTSPLLTLLFSISCIALSSCGPTPAPVVSGDTYCDKAKFISSTPEEAAVLGANEQLWRPLVEQIADHNDTVVASKCLGNTKTATVTVGNPVKAGAPDATTSPGVLSRVGSFLHL